jgi:hypothetical protein
MENRPLALGLAAFAYQQDSPADGAVAWISTQRGRPAAYEVHVANSDGTQQMHPSSPEVARHSLRLSADRHSAAIA